MRARKRPVVRLSVEALEVRCNPSPTLLANVPLPNAGPSQGMFSPAAVVADLDGDGQQEVLAPGGNSLYAYKMNPANGQMFIDHVYSQGSPVLPLGATPVVVNLPSGPAVFLGDAASNVFGWDARTGNLLPGWPVRLGTGSLPADQMYGGLAAGDLDGDGIPEIVTTSWNHQITALHANGQVMWRFNNDDSVFGGVAIGDLNRDGLPEVVVGGDSSNSAYYWDGGRINCLSWDGRREWVKRTDQVIWSSPALADLNGDGYLEVIQGTGYNYPAPVPPNPSYPGNFVYVLDANGNDLPGWPYVTANPSVDARPRPSPAVADLNGDGRLDIAINDGQGQLLALTSSGQRIWSVQASTSIDPYAGPTVADVNNDGLPDVFLETQNGHSEAFAGATGTKLWDYPDGLGHITAGAVGHLRGDASWQLAVVSQRYDPQQNAVLSPSNLLIFDLGSSSLTPPWAQSRQDATANAVVRPDTFTTAYVTTLYQGTLGRPPSAGELAAWLPIYRHAPSLRTPTLQFLTSPAVLQVKINAWYQTYLGRGADAGGLAAWTAALNNGQPDSFVQANLAASQEAFSRTGGTNSSWVSYLYQTVLGRSPAASELGFWVNNLNANPGGRYQVALAILRSPEATNRLVTQWYAAYHPGGQTTPPADTLAAVGWDLRRGQREEVALANVLTSTGDYVRTQQEGSWLRALYGDVLQRFAAPSETAFWLQTMESGTSAVTVASILVKSSEYHRVLVRGWFQTFLHRGVADPDLAYFAGLLDRGTPWTSVMQILISSDEYWRNRAGGNVNQFINQVWIDLLGHPVPSQGISIWGGRADVRTALPAALMLSGEFYQYSVGGTSFASWDGRFLRRFGATPPDLGRVLPPGAPFDGLSQALANAWAAGARPDDLQAQLLASAEYVRVAWDKAFWGGARWLS